MYKKLAAVALGVSLLGGCMAAAVPAPAQAASDVMYTCWRGTPVPQYLKASSDPRKCNGLYKISKAGKYVVVIDNRKIKTWADLINNVKKGYTSTQKWCSANSFTCGVITSIGTMLLGDVIRRSITG